MMAALARKALVTNVQDGGGGGVGVGGDSRAWTDDSRWDGHLVGGVVGGVGHGDDSGGPSDGHR
jgi:hypothetical protein